MFIISGMGRGGTSIVACMLREHPQIDLLFEVSDVCRTPKEPWQEREREGLKNGVILADKILDGSLFWKERYPERLMKWYHNTKFLFIYRNGLDMAAGLQAICDVSVRDTSIKWNAYVNQSQAFMKKYPYRCMLLKYSDFILRTEHHLKSICNFIGIPYSDKMFNFTMEVKEYRKKYGNKINTSRINLWDKYMEQPNLSPERREIANALLIAREHMCSNLFKLGYIDEK